METSILSCIIAVALSMFGTHAYDVTHPPKYTQGKEALAQPDVVNVYVGEANHYCLTKDDGGVKVWTQPSSP